MSVDDRIKRLTGYFREQVQVILSLEATGAADGQISLYRKALFVSMLDCLAGIRFNKKNCPELTKQNRRRFTRFLEEFGNWPTGSLVSTPFLFSRLDLDKESRTGKLLERALDQLARDARNDPHAGVRRVWVIKYLSLGGGKVGMRTKGWSGGGC